MYILSLKYPSRINLQLFQIGLPNSIIHGWYEAHHVYRVCVKSKCFQIIHLGNFIQLIGFILTWWRHQMETFSALLAICAGNSPVHGEFPVKRPVTQSFDVFFDLRLKKPVK